MTNEELIEQYRRDPNDIETMHQLYQQSRKLILKLATESARSFHCLFYRDNGKDYTAYTDSIIDELVSEGTVALIEAIRSDRYAPDAGKFSTYVYPFIKGAMHRWLENNIGAVAVSKHEMQKVRQAQQMYHEGIPINEIAQSMKLSEAQLSQLLNYNTHALSLDQLIEEDFSSEGGEQPHYSMEYGVILKIWLSLLPEVFEKLKKKDKYLLGHLYGVYGYEKKSPDTLALELELTTAGVYKARDTALKHLQKLYRESDLYIWRRAYQITKAAASKGGPNWSYPSDL